MAVKIITDSTSDLTSGITGELGITVVPLNVHFGTETYRDGVDLKTEEFYQKLTESKTQLEEILVQTAGFLKKDVIAENLITSLNNFEQIISSLNSELSGLIEKCKNIRTRINNVLNASEFDSAIKIKNLTSTDEQIIEVNNLLHTLSNQPGVLSEDGNLELNLKLKNTELSLE